MPELTPSERSLRASIAAHHKHALYDPVESTAPARKAFLDRFEKQADPDGVLSPAERSRRAQHLRKAYFKALALKSAKVRALKSAKAATSDSTSVELPEVTQANAIAKEAA